MRSLALFPVIIVAASLAASAALGQGRPDLSGTWMLQAAAGGERVGTEPQRLVIAQSATELTLTRTSTRGEQTVTYRLDGVETVESNMLGDTRVRAGWDGDRLLVTRTRTLNAPSGPVEDTSQEAYDRDGGTLVVTATRKMPDGSTRAETFRYSKP